MYCIRMVEHFPSFPATIVRKKYSCKEKLFFIKDLCRQGCVFPFRTHCHPVSVDKFNPNTNNFYILSE